MFLVTCSRGENKRTYSGAPVILISVDTLRSDRLPAYGYSKVETPNLDALRRDSILYQRAYSHCPMTLPSHASIFTGMAPTEHQVRNNIGQRFDGSRLTTLAEILRKNGYATGAAVSSYVLRSETGIDDGFDFYDDLIVVAKPGSASEHQRSGMETLKAARTWLQQRGPQPFFLFFHIYEPHAPYSPPQPYQKYSDPYDGEVAASDAVVGELIATLKSIGFYDKALIVFLSDHGEGLWQHGEDQHGILLYRESLQVPLMVKLPGSAESGSTVADPFPLAAVFDEILAVAGIAVEKPSRGPIYSETLYPRIHLGWSELRSLIDGRYHYIEGPSQELYDLIADPGETNNIIDGQRRVAAALRKTLDSYPSTITPVGAIDPEEAEKLAALGYIGTPQNRTGPLPNPRDEIRNLDEVRAAFRLAADHRLDQAATALRNILQKNPSLLDVASRLGEVLVESGNYDEAIKVYRTAIQQSPGGSPDLLLAVSSAYLKAGRNDEAVRHAEMTLKTHPRESHELLARAAVAKEDFGEAERQARLAIEAGERQPQSIHILAEVQRSAGRLEDSLKTIEQAERRASEMGVSHLIGIDYLRGDVLARLDRPEEAIAAYRREIAASPEYLQSYANLAVVYMIQENPVEARKILEQMAAANPHRGAYLLAAKTLEAFDDRKGAARWRQRAAQ